MSEKLTQLVEDITEIHRQTAAIWLATAAGNGVVRALEDAGFVDMSLFDFQEFLANPISWLTARTDDDRNPYGFYDVNEARQDASVVITPWYIDEFDAADRLNYLMDEHPEIHIVFVSYGGLEPTEHSRPIRERCISLTYPKRAGTRGKAPHG